MRSVPICYKQNKWSNGILGVEYLHRDPVSRRGRRKGKSQIWDSKIWSRVPRDSDPRKTALARASSIYKRQTRPLIREGAPQKQDRNCQYWSWAPDGARHQDLLTDWLTVSRNVTLTLTMGYLWDSWQPVRTWVRKQRTLLGSVTKQRLVKTQQTEKNSYVLQWNVECVWINVSAILTCSYDL
jgi:hypothetical protein